MVTSWIQSLTSRKLDSYLTMAQTYRRKGCYRSPSSQMNMTRFDAFTHQLDSLEKANANKLSLTRALKLYLDLMGLEIRYARETVELEHSVAIYKLVEAFFI